MPSVTRLSARAVAVLLAASFGSQGLVVNAACNADNCLRALRNTAVISSAQTFCSSFTGGAWDTAAPLPTYAANCKSSAPAISSACSCIATTAPPPSTTVPGTTTTPGTTIAPDTTTAPDTCLPVTSYITVTAGGTSSCGPSTTVTAAPIVGPPGHHLVPNSLFEADEPSWIRETAPGATYRIVNASADGSFSGVFGPRMLQVYRGSSVSVLTAVIMEVPTAAYPNPAGRDWVVTALFRTDGLQCSASFGWSVPGWGSRGVQPDIAFGRWHAVSVTIDNSAAGAAANIQIYVNGFCWTDGFIYVDGVSLS